MSAAAKALLMLLKNKRVRNALIGIVVGIFILFLMLISAVVYITQNSNTATAAANIAVREYNYWQSHSPSDDGLSCQGEKYCSYFNYGITDWCCFFAGYCYREAGIKDKESGYASVTNNWTANLENMGKLKTAASGYTPQVGNPVFFNYNGRTNYTTTNFVAHVGVVVEVTDDTITVIAGNEYNGATSNWSNVSYVNKYTLSKNNDCIACYGDVGSSIRISTGLTANTRNVICHNEIGVIYDEITNDYYGAVVANDNGALSIGVYCWHGNKALTLLQKAYQNNSSQIESVATSYSSSGSSVLSAIKNGANWTEYIPDKTVCNCIKAMLLTDAGKLAQDEVSLEDAQEYIDICTDNGLTDSKAIIYCSDILNQYGAASFNANVYGNGIHGVLHGVTSSMSLDDIYHSKRAWSDSNYNYKSRRKWTYDYLKDLSDESLNSLSLPTAQVSLQGTLAERTYYEKINLFIAICSPDIIFFFIRM